MRLFLTNSVQNTNEPPQTGGGLNVNPEWEAHKTPGPLIPDAQMEQAIGQPQVRLIPTPRVKPFE